MRLLTWLLSIGAVLLALSPGAGSAQRDIDTHRFTPALDAQGFLGVPGTATPGSLRPRFGFFLDYAYAPATLPQDDGSGSSSYDKVVEQRFTMSASAELGLGSRAAIGALVPLALYQTAQDVRSLRTQLPMVAAGDPLLSARYRLLGVASDDPLLPKDGPGLGLELRARLPLGADTAYLGEGTTRLGARLLFDMQLLGAGIGGFVGYERRMHARHFWDEELEHELQAGVGAKVPLPSLHPFSAVGELRAAIDFQSKETSSFEGELGLRAALEEWTLTLAGGGAFTGELGAPDARIIFGVWYAPAVSDSDRDGIDDDEDECPQLPEDPDGFQDDDGCPDPDNDNDLVPDIDDLCPNDEALEGQDEDEDGCTDAAKPG